jgi:asparagine synthase (glutamine-hydrolysing)
MCGIAGTVRLGDRELVQRMTSVMAYRGPDDSGLYACDDAILGHRRLSILDLSEAGHQPMESDGGRFALVHNGEIYNFKELRSTLEAKGHRFHTDTDTEVVLAAYATYGPACLEHFEGMFAFALWDRGRKQLMLARDRLGMKPLFYVEHRGGLAFASELKPLLLLPDLERRVNRRALRSINRYGGNFEDESMIASIFKVKPGHCLIWRDGVTQSSAYWRHPYPAPERAGETAQTEELRTRLRRVVRSHMISDAPIGAALSGGIDSSAIVALMAEATPGQIETFTVGHGPNDPDLSRARLVADHCRTNHHEIIVEAQSVADILPRIVWHLEEPLGQMETVQLFVNYREAAKFVKVLLVGDGADELFGGYMRYRLLDPRLPLPLPVQKDLYRRVYQHSDEQPITASARLLTRALWKDPPLFPMLDDHPRFELPLLDVDRRSHAVERALNYDQRTLLPHLYLKRADALGMAHSLELRVPFLDREIVEFAARVSGALMVGPRAGKHILRRALAPVLPAEIVERRKHPLQMHVNQSMLESLDYLCDHLLRPADVRARGFFDPQRVETLRRNRPGGRRSRNATKFWSWRIWSMILSEVWARLFLDRTPTPQAPTKFTDVL